MLTRPTWWAETLANRLEESNGFHSGHQQRPSNSHPLSRDPRQVEAHLGDAILPDGTNINHALVKAWG